MKPGGVLSPASWHRTSASEVYPWRLAGPPSLSAHLLQALERPPNLPVAAPCIPWGVAAFEGYPIAGAGIAGFVAWTSLLPCGEIALGPVGLARGPHETRRTGQTPTSAVLKRCRRTPKEYLPFYRGSEEAGAYCKRRPRHPAHATRGLHSSSAARPTLKPNPRTNPPTQIQPHPCAGGAAVFDWQRVTESNAAPPCGAVPGASRFPICGQDARNTAGKDASDTISGSVSNRRNRRTPSTRIEDERTSH